MDLNNLKLSPHLLSELYKNSLVVIDKPGISTVKSKEKKTWKFLGDNRRNILLVVNYSDARHVPPEELAFLDNLLSACKLNMNDVAIINLHNQDTTDFTGILSFFESNIVFLFGVEPKTLGLPIHFPHFQVQPFNGITFLSSPGLTDISTDKILKSKLWVCLRRIFNI